MCVVGGTAAPRSTEASAGRPIMTCTPRRWPRGARWLTGATLLSLVLVLPARAIEMFTNFGDGSRIGLPSLEVPVQAYPGIPLRSDRIRARSRAQQLRRAAASQPGVTPAGDGLPGIQGGGITVRPMAPQAHVPSAVTGPSRPGSGFPQAPAPSGVPSPAGASPKASGGTNWSNLVPAQRGVAEPVVPPRPTSDLPGRNQTLPGFTQPVFPGAPRVSPAASPVSPGATPRDPNGAPGAGQAR